jgi:predicted nucleic acid-binding protein
MRKELPVGTTVLTDVSALAIGLTEDHPAYEYVRPWLTDALDGPTTLLVPEYYALRAQFIMTRNFDVDETEARNTVQTLIRSPARIICATEADLLTAYRISVEKKHDVYDSYLLALARAFEVDYLVTTDSDFDRLCADEQTEYRNPIPDDELSVLDG